MSQMGWYKFGCTATLIDAIDDGDFFALVGGGTAWRLVEVRVFQTGTTTLTMDGLLISRGTGSAGGVGATEREWQTNGPAPTVTCLTMPTTDVDTAGLNWQYPLGWNLLQEAIWPPIPEIMLPCIGTEDIGLHKITTTAHQDIGVGVIWEEYIGQ